MSERQEVQCDVVFVQFEHQIVHTECFMKHSASQHHPFAVAGGAAGVENAGQVVHGCFSLSVRPFFGMVGISELQEVIKIYGHVVLFVLFDIAIEDDDFFQMRAE